MHTGQYWDPKTREHTSGPGPGARAYSALPLDWDADGDLDLVVGDNHSGRENGKFVWHGYIWLYRRVGGQSTEPQASRRRD